MPINQIRIRRRRQREMDDVLGVFVVKGTYEKPEDALLVVLPGKMGQGQEAMPDESFLMVMVRGDDGGTFPVPPPYRLLRKGRGCPPPENLTALPLIGILRAKFIRVYMRHLLVMSKLFNTPICSPKGLMEGLSGRYLTRSYYQGMYQMRLKISDLIMIAGRVN